MMAENDIIELPEPASAAVDFVSAEDKRYFEDHPLARHYDRRPFPEELWPGNTPARGWMVRVYQIEPGVRFRVPYPEGGRPAKDIVKK